MPISVSSSPLRLYSPTGWHLLARFLTVTAYCRCLMKALSLADNRLTRVPAALEKLTLLSCVDLSGNYLLQVLPPSLRPPYKLRDYICSFQQSLVPCCHISPANQHSCATIVLFPVRCFSFLSCSCCSSCYLWVTPVPPPFNARALLLISGSFKTFRSRGHSGCSRACLTCGWWTSVESMLRRVSLTGVSPSVLPCATSALWPRT